MTKMLLSHPVVPKNMTIVMVSFQYHFEHSINYQVSGYLDLLRERTLKPLGATHHKPRHVSTCTHTVPPHVACLRHSRSIESLLDRFRTPEVERDDLTTAHQQR